MWIFCVFCSVLCLLCLCARLFVCALWSPAGRGLASWLSFVVSGCEFVIFPLVSWVGCGRYFIVSIPDLCTLTYFATLHFRRNGITYSNFHLGRYIVGYTFGNHVLRLCPRVAVKLNCRSYVRRYTSPNENFEYSYPLND